MNQAKELTCEDRVQSAFESRISDINYMLSGCEADDIRLGDDGTTDTILIDPLGNEYRYYSDERESYCDNDQFDLESFIADHLDDINESMYEEFCNYGLSVDMVEANTFDDQPDSYLRYQISWGGPSEEFRFYHNGDRVYRAEFWFLDWFDGAHVNCLNDHRVQTLIDWFDEVGYFNKEA